MIEYLYYKNEDRHGDDVEYQSPIKGKIPFNTEAEFKEGFPTHYPGCTVWSWYVVGEES
jgi:hypothetical protein